MLNNQSILGSFQPLSRQDFSLIVSGKGTDIISNPTLSLLSGMTSLYGNVCAEKHCFNLIWASRELSEVTLPLPSGMTSLDGKVCAEGFYCPENSTRNNQEECTVGYHCPEGSPEPIK